MMNTNEKLLPPEINLIRFNKPELVLGKSKKTLPPSSKKKVEPLESEDDVATPKKLECTEVLNSIVPIRKWIENDKHYRQSISSQLASKQEVKKLGEKLDTYLKQFNAKEIGICPIKWELYTQCFNEAIRQTTLNCVERGYMMIKIRDEIKTTVDGFKELYESATALRIRKALLREQKKVNLLERANRLKLENETLESELMKILAQTEEVVREMAETRQMEIDSHAKQISDIKKANDLIKDQLLSIIAPKKSNRP